MKREKKKTLFYSALSSFAHLPFPLPWICHPSYGRRRRSVHISTPTGGHVKWLFLWCFWIMEILVQPSSEVLYLELFSIITFKYGNSFISIASLCWMSIIACVASCMCVPVCAVVIWYCSSGCLNSRGDNPWIPPTKTPTSWRDEPGAKKEPCALNSLLCLVCLQLAASDLMLVLDGQRNAF